MNRESPFHLATSALRVRLRSGRFVQGEQLMVSEICRDLGLSQTPVREALAFLAGEGLIEDRRGFGYFAWRLDAVDLAELYTLQAALVTTALHPLGEIDGGVDIDRASRLAMEPRSAPGGIGDPEGAPGPRDPAVDIERLFAALVRRGRSRILMGLQRRLGDRLAPARRTESLVLGDPAAEIVALVGAAGQTEAVHQWSLAYHARRIAHAPAIVSAMRSEAVGGAWR